MLTGKRRSSVQLERRPRSQRGTFLIGGELTLSHISLGVWVLALLVAVSGLAEARSMKVRESYPATEMIVDGHNAQYMVRFDGWIDHAASQLNITATGTGVETPVSTRDSEPEVLAASS